MNYKTIITYIILILFAGIMYYLRGIYGTLHFIGSILIYTLVFFILHYIWIKIRKKPLMYFPDFIKYFLSRVSIFLVLIVSLLGGLAYVSNEIYPAPMPEYTLSNGEKIVKFQAMSHIGTNNFYNNIVENLIQHKKDGGVYFFEGVKPGTKENGEKFNNAIGIKFDEDLYKNFSKLYGLTYQDNNDFLGLVNELDFNIDLNMNEIIEFYEEKISTKTNSGEIFKSKIPIDANKIIIETLSQLNDKELKILVYINQAILNFIIGNNSTQNFLTNNFANKDLFEIIIDKRNEVVANNIISSKYNNIYMTYGLLHFKGILELLKENDPKWTIISTKNLYPIKD